MQVDKDIYKLHAEYCKLMANPKRVEIIFLLGENEMCVDHIASKMGVKVPNISQHLAIMRAKGVVSVRREGTKMYYSLDNQKTLQACLLMREAMVEQMDKQFKKIKTIMK